MRLERLFRAYEGKNPLTRVWRRTQAEAEDDIKMWGRAQNPKIISKDIGDVLKNRKKTGFRGIL